MAVVEGVSVQSLLRSFLLRLKCNLTLTGSGYRIYFKRASHPLAFPGSSSPPPLGFSFSGCVWECLVFYFIFIWHFFSAARPLCHERYDTIRYDTTEGVGTRPGERERQKENR